ncbi:MULTISPECIES: AsmA family protein [unclassified Pseudomonas]|uniref:AsmA family protein n=1 Tax=unclassified Pseudomonas TaxID=196821 RepID=UPI00244D0B12|nr:MULTISPECIES: AsmA family protein [unclassified Pseudomonas]MDG9926552.1 AsmA family protein [Pseudomonas sp. GD04042]MDH0481364.1 AsmA family protein [Pseudomonas sp. GD04015]MDH0603313.1 AsmA family protein [Pseudomonas sp. GD03869]
MKAFGKILGLAFLGLLLVVVGLGFALTHLFDPNDYKDEIRQLARDKANLELTLNGDIGWSLFPWLGLELTDATLASAETPDKPFADLRLLGLSVRVLPLLYREVQMSDIRVDGLNLTLQRDDKGRSNWEGIGRPASATGEESTAQTPAEPREPTAQTTDESGRPVKLDIDSLTISNSRVDFHDAQSGQQFSAEGIELSTGAIREGTDIPVKLLAFLGTNQPVLRAKTELQGLLRFDRGLKRYQLQDLKLAGEASGEPLNGKTLTFSSQGQLLLDQSAQVAEWTGIKLSANQLRALGELKLRDLDKTAQLEGNLSLAQFNLREFLDGLGIALPPMRDNGTLSRVELSARLAGTPNSLAFNDLSLKLDDSTLGGSLAVSDFAKRALRVQLKGDRLDLDRYLPPEAKDASAGAARKNEVKEATAAAGASGTTPLPNAPTQQAWSEAPLLPLDTLRKLDVQADLGLGQLTLSKLPIEDARISLTAKGGLIDLKEMRGDLHGGEFAVRSQLDARPAVPVLTANKQLKRVPLEKLIEARGEKAPVRGQLDLNSDLRTQGNSEKAWIDALNGTASFSLSNGVLIDANLEQQLCQGIATLNRKSLSGEPRGKDTPFEELHGNLNFHNGVASNPDLKARIPGLTVNGDGALDLRVLGMDYRVGIVIEGDKRAMPDPACQVNERYVGLEWPLRCRGPLELGAKACRLDKDGLGKVAARLAGDKLSEKLEEKLGDKVTPELKDALKGLFKR